MVRCKMAIVILLPWLATTCCTNPFAPSQAEPRYLAPILPQNDPNDSTAAAHVLSNFKYAYENNDLDVYENCLDREFVFIYIDQDRYGRNEKLEIPRDGTSGDLYRTRRLFETFDEIRLDIWIPLRRPPEDSLTPDHIGQQWEVWEVYFHLALRDISGDYGFLQYEAQGWAIFKLRRSRDGHMRIRVWEDQSLSG